MSRRKQIKIFDSFQMTSRP